MTGISLTKPDETTVLGRYDAFLFDMDGTILTSIAAAERAWSAWAARIGAPAADVLSYMHGRLALDTVGRFAPATADLDNEVRWLDQRELEDLDGIEEVPGAGAFLRALPAERWAVVTSANRALALKRIAAAGLPVPPLLLTSDDVSRGKPDPEGYIRAAQSLRVEPTSCLVFEDTRAGLKAGLAAGAQVVQIAGTQAADDLPVRLTVDGYEGFSVSREGNAARLAIVR
ncbi:HAD-IA family hydrolase [Taklimakanibacter lacteus]|uniref:HAD-IA family hydrolase n=1 Tax=Taklimakanibacter lacteus TaxID=2268456 RepID=UPI000E663608